MLKIAPLAFAAVLSVAITPSSAGAVSRAKQCGHGYHRDKAGHCQPNRGGVNRYCAPGYVRQPFPGGWRCVLPHH